METEANRSFDFSSFHNSFKRRQGSKDRFSIPVNVLGLNQGKHSVKSLNKTLENQINPVTKTVPNDKSDPKLNTRKISQDFYKSLIKNIPNDNKEFSEIVNGYFKLEETVALYEERNQKMRLRIEELEKENVFLGNKLKEAWKLSKPAKKLDTADKRLSLLKQKESIYAPNTQTGKYLKGLAEKYGVGTKEFYQEIEGLLDYKEHKLSMSIAHYKSTISNLQMKLKRKNSEYMNGVSVGSVGTMFRECVEDVKKHLGDKRIAGKMGATDKLRILEKFLLNENILRMVYERLVEDQTAEGIAQNPEAGLEVIECDYLY